MIKVPKDHELGDVRVSIWVIGEETAEKVGNSRLARAIYWHNEEGEPRALILEDVTIPCPPRACQRYCVMADIPRGRFRGRVETHSGSPADGILHGIRLMRAEDYEIDAGD